MNKEKILKVVDIVSFSAVIVATVLVFVFQFVAEPVLVKISMVFYSIGFLMLGTQFAFSVYENFSKKTEQDKLQIKPKENKDLENQSVSQETKKNTDTKSKVWNICGLCGSVLMFVFTLIVLILY